MRKKQLMATSAIVVLAGAFGQAAQAQDDGVRLDTIVVEAERVESDLQDTPVAVTSFNSDQLEELGVANLRQLQDFVPNVSIINDGVLGRMNPEFSIRGVGAGVPTSSALTERPIGLYIDGIFLARAQGSLLSIIDAEKIEILRGPQGTLFGRNATGGAITYTSKKPSEEFEGQVKIKVGNFNLREAQGSVSIPLSDKLFVRGVYANNFEDGYVRRGDKKLGDRREEAARLQLRALPANNVTIDISGTYTEFKTNGDPRVTLRTEFGADGGLGTATLPGRGAMQSLETLLIAQGEGPFVENDPRLVRGLYEVPDYCVLNNPNPYDTTNGDACENFIESDLVLLTGEINWDISDALTLTSLTGYLKTTQEASLDFGWSGAYRRSFNVDSEAFSQELRAVYQTDRLNLVGGAIFYMEDAFEDELPTVELNQGFGAGIARTEAQVLAGETTLRRDEDYTSDAKSYGVYAQATYSLTDRLDLTGGLRYSYDEKDAIINYNPLPLDPRGSGQAIGSESWGNLDWRVAISYDVSDDMMVYASVTDAYKAGVGSDGSLENLLDAGISSGPVAFVDPEEARGYELGIRSEWFNNRFRVNLTGYFTEYTNRQQSVFISDPVTGQNRFEIQSVGAVDFYGVEGEFALALSDDLFLHAAAAVGEYDQKGRFEGATLPGIPKKSLSVGAQHTKEIDRGAIVTSFNYGWSSHYWSGFNAPPVDGLAFGGAQRRTPAIGLLNGRVEYTPDHGNWSIAAFVNNLTDKEYATSYFGDSFQWGFRDRSVVGTTGRPRSWGVSVTASF